MLDLKDLFLQEIYCSGCYSRSFGLAGFRGSQSCNWADEKSTARLRAAAVTVAEAAAIKAKEGDANACIRCRGKVRIVIFGPLGCVSGFLSGFRG